MGQVVQIVGSLLVLAGFILAQRGVLRPTSLVYLTLNLAGSGVLAVDAALGRQWGFLLLEGVWAIVSAVGLATALRQRIDRERPRAATVGDSLKQSPAGRRSPQSAPVRRVHSDATRESGAPD